MSRLTDLIEKAKSEDRQLGADLEREFRALSSRLPFGLNFERHQPEAVELPRRPIRRGDKVRVLPPRGDTTKGDQRLWEVKRLVQNTNPRLAELESIEALPEQTTHPVEDLVVVAAFGDTIYPGLVSTGRVNRGGDRPFHTVINGENYHALKALTWTHRGKVDAIYIDPPYNTRDKDWKYNNDYVNNDDLYRHSKWLAMMERRLLIAAELLNPADSVLIVTIDEKEYLRLGLLLEQLFPNAQMQMVSTIIKPEGTNRFGEFSRTNEYVYFLMFGNARVDPTSDDMSGRENESAISPIEWRNLRRRENTSTRDARPNQFYAIFVDKEMQRIHSVGDALSLDIDKESIVAPSGCFALFPLKPDGTEMLWGVTPDAMRNLITHGFARVRNPEAGPSGAGIQYLAQGTVKAINDGTVEITGRCSQGAVEGFFKAPKVMPKTTWNKVSHNAQTSGTLILTALLPGRDFPFPKSLYAVEDCLRFFVADNKSAIVLDFFAGSGTTAHAVMRLNKQDGGHRQCISVTNNEVAAGEQDAMRRDGLRPGDLDWEKYGICDYITKPRVKAAITGQTPDGNSIDAEYQFGEIVRQRKPRNFFQIGFTDPSTLRTSVKKKQFVALINGLPQTLVKGQCPYIVSKDHSSSVLFDAQHTDDWLAELEGQNHITDFYIVSSARDSFENLKRQVMELLGDIAIEKVGKVPMADGLEANAEFFTLTYETPVSVNYQTAFSRIAPLLWMRAGCEGDRIDKLPQDGWGVVQRYGLLTQVDASAHFLKAVRKATGLRIAFIVTDDERRFQAIARKLPDHIEAIRLYESYLTNFAFANGESA